MHSTAIFPLVITGAPQPTLEWYKDGELLREDGKKIEV